MQRPVPLPRRMLAEFVGAGLLVTVVVGSGIAAQRLSPDDVGLQLLENSTATVFGLTVLIVMLEPVSSSRDRSDLNLWLGELVATARRMFSDTFTGIAPASVPAFLAAQLVGGAVGVALVRALYPDVAAAADEVVVPHEGKSPLPS